MKRHSPKLMQLWILLLCSAMVGAQTPPPRSTPNRSTTMITPNFPNVDIAVVAEAVGAATGITFILDPRVRANVTLINGQPVSPQQLYNIFLSILAVNNFSAQRAGNVVKIVPETVARTMPGNDMPRNLNMAGDESVTTVLEVKNLNPQTVASVLRQLVSQAGTLFPVPGSNTLVIQDRASNVARIQAILARVDQGTNSSFDVIPLKNAVATEVAKVIASLSTALPAEAAGGTPAPRVVADDRTNSLLVSGDPGQRLRIAAIVESLDAEVNNGGGVRTFILRYAKAEELTATLKAHVTGIAAAATASPAGGAGAAAAPSVAANADRSVTIVPDVPTNKIIITAPPRTMISLAAIIDELDIAAPQVHIEAIIADIRNSKAADLGVNWVVFSNEEGTSVPVSAFVSPVANSSIVDLARVAASPSTAVASGAVPAGATFGVGRLLDNGINFAAMLRAMRTDKETNIVSTPSVTATNNEESELNSVEEVPLLNSTTTNTNSGGGGSNPFVTNSVNRQPIGTILKVTPQIIPGTDEVILKIDLESSALSNRSGDAGSLITSKRIVKTSVRVQSGTTIVIGGMMSDAKDTSETRVPFLGRIPLVKELFRTRGGTRDKSTLMIFIQPKILFDAAQANAQTRLRQDEIREQQRLQIQKRELLPLLPYDTPPELPIVLPRAPSSTAPAGAPAKP